MADDDFQELSPEEWDTLEALLDKVWRVVNRDLSTPTMAVPATTFVKAGENVGFRGRRVRERLQARDDFFKAQYTAADGQTPVHTWFKGSPHNVPDDYAPRPARKVRLTANGPLREVFPDKRYRFNKRQWWGFQLIKAADAGELA